MENYRERSWASSPHSPAPLALQDFMSQNALTTSTHEGSVSRLDTAGPEAEGRSSVIAVDDSSNKPTPLTQELMFHSDDHAGEEQEDPTPELPGVGPEPDADPVPDWKAIRVQIPLGKKVDKKMEWIRGWSEEIVSHGDAVYCACSGVPKSGILSPLLHHAPGHARTSPSPSEKQSAQVNEADLDLLCPNCNRPSSPVLSPEPGDMEPYESRSKALRKKMSGLVMRVMKGRRTLSPSPLNPSPLNPSSLKMGIDSVQPEAGVSGKGAKIAPDDAPFDPDDLSSSDEESPQGGNTLRDRQERLARAQQLLDRHRH